MCVQHQQLPTRATAGSPLAGGVRRYFDVQKVIAAGPGKASANTATLIPAGAIIPSPAEVSDHSATLLVCHAALLCIAACCCCPAVSTVGRQLSATPHAAPWGARMCADTMQGTQPRCCPFVLQGNTTNECAYAGEDSREAHRGGRYIAVGASVPAPALYVSSDLVMPSGG